ncbi:MAG TPA: DUF885 domain-containing protein [Vicinamibacterales bacterium]|jgi:hypothetical protein
MRLRTFALTFLLLSIGSSGAERASAQDPRAWVATSNTHAQLLLDVFAKFAPEGAGQFGVSGLDNEVTRISIERIKEGREATQAALAKLQELLKIEKDPPVRQDLEILIRSAQNNLRASELSLKRQLPYANVTGLVFGGLRALLDPQVSAERRPAAVVRLRKYTGGVLGIPPITTQAMQLTRERMKDATLLGPARQQVERDLANGPILMQGIEQLFEQFKLEGWREPFATLKQQLSEYEQFVRTEILPRSRADFRLPPDLYALALEQVGVGITPDALTKMARESFKEIQAEMQKLAPAVAKARGLASADYREVIRALKKEQLVGDAILPHYRSRLTEIEAIIRRENLVTLPQRDARIRIATDAEAAQTPAPNMRPPRLLGNTGEMGEFILPLNVPAAPGSKAAAQQLDDFTYQAASWTLTAHEARPGHEMQFAKIIEGGVSIARALFAFNSTNVEGWGLYAEWMMLPYMPPDGQLVSLQFRLMRAARAFLDPELHMGRVTPDEARKILRDDVVLSEGMTESEVERYMFRSPAQATSYFYGYTQLRELRPEVERAMGGKFNAKDFHDFVLAQGLLPPELLKQAVMTQFSKR